MDATQDKIWNDAIERAADIAAAFDAAMNSAAMVPFAHDPYLVNAIYDRDFAIATRIRELKRVTPAAPGGGRMDLPEDADA